MTENWKYNKHCHNGQHEQVNMTEINYGLSVLVVFKPIFGHIASVKLTSLKYKIQNWYPNLNLYIPIFVSLFCPFFVELFTRFMWPIFFKWISSHRYATYFIFWIFLFLLDFESCPFFRLCVSLFCMLHQTIVKRRYTLNPFYTHDT